MAGLPPPQNTEILQRLGRGLVKICSGRGRPSIARTLSAHLDVYTGSFFFVFVFFAKGECQAGRVAPICPVCISAVNVATTYYLKL